ncbi:MAG TPA: YIP1 family protein, partial [bacterium]|nr:YIP1 family protein [bacterium]
MRTSRSLAAVALLVRSPASAFEFLLERPGWMGAFVLSLVLFALAYAVQLPQSLRYQREVTRSTMEKLELPEAQLEEALRRIPEPGNLTAGEAVKQILLPVGFLIPVFFLGAFVFHLAAKAFGADAPFKLSLGIYSVANVASALGALLKGFVARAS